MSDTRRVTAKCIGWSVKKKNDPPRWVQDGAPKPIDFEAGESVTFVAVMLDVEPRTVLVTRGEEHVEVRESFLSPAD